MSFYSNICSFIYLCLVNHVLESWSSCPIWRFQADG